MSKQSGQMAVISSAKEEQVKTQKYTVFNTFTRDWQLWVMILPAILVVFIFNYIPMYGVQLAFREFDFAKGLTGGTFVGFKYFNQFISNYQFWNLIKNTVTLCLTTIVVGFPAPIILAIIVNQIRQRKFNKFLQTVLYMPHFISTVVMVAILVVLLSPATGVIGNLINSLGFDINLLGDVRSFVPVYVTSDIWQHCGWDSIIYISALSAVDTQLYDASKVDGANRWQTILYVDIPTIVPTIIILLILRMGNVLNIGFEKVFLMQNNLNLPVSEVISTYVYKIGIISNQFSYAAAIGLFNTIINFIFLIATNMISKKAANISLW